MSDLTKKPVSHLVRFEGIIAAGIDSWVADHSYESRTAAINHMCKFFLEAIEIEKLRRENADLREKILNLAMAGCKAPGTDIQAIAEYLHESKRLAK